MSIWVASRSSLLHQSSELLVNFSLPLRKHCKVLFLYFVFCILKPKYSFLGVGVGVGCLFLASDLLGAESLWPLLLAVCGFAALAQLLLLPFFPESPPYLLIQKEDKAACLKGKKGLLPSCRSLIATVGKEQSCYGVMGKGCSSMVEHRLCFQKVQSFIPSITQLKVFGKRIVAW